MESFFIQTFIWIARPLDDLRPEELRETQHEVIEVVAGLDDGQMQGRRKVEKLSHRHTDAQA